MEPYEPHGVTCLAETLVHHMGLSTHDYIVRSS